MEFHSFICSDLNVLFGRDLGWEYSPQGLGSLPLDVDKGVARACQKFFRLREECDPVVMEFITSDRLDRAKTGLLVAAIREKVGIVPAFAGEVRTWADSQNLTAYEIGGKVEGRKKQRWQRWLSGEGLKTVEEIQADLIERGYRLKIEKI